MVLDGKERKNVQKMDGWAVVAAELEGEDLKEKIYDNTLFSLCGDLEGKAVLDYGAGPAVVASRAMDNGASVKAFDISKDMREIAVEKLGKQNVYEAVEEIPGNYFDIVLCNLVLCIVPEEEVAVIVRNIRNMLKTDGIAYVGFCNPRIFDVPESVIDFRKQTGDAYENNHEYTKVKKEGNYEIMELHRPIEWYEEMFRGAGFEVDVNFTPEYDIGKRKISDFIIFKLKKEGLK
ncbi:class I SAM-dependent methyltransferase [Candidatus Micrarchaeota archaeon]|nr:class I SAM-dependent methyltransferase [Candidatus Micrarchaeota archaeon]